MRRYLLGAVIALGAFWFGILSFLRGQVWLGLCFVGIALLRALPMVMNLRTAKPDDEVHLDIAERSGPASASTPDESQEGNHPQR